MDGSLVNEAKERTGSSAHIQQGALHSPLTQLRPTALTTMSCVFPLTGRRGGVIVPSFVVSPLALSTPPPLPPLLLAIAGRYVLQPELLLMSVARNFRRPLRRRRGPLLLRRRRRQGNSFAPRAANEETVLVLVLVKGSHDREGMMGMKVMEVVVVGMTLDVAAADEFPPDSTPVHRVHSSSANAAVAFPVRRLRSPAAHFRGRGGGGVLVGLGLLVVGRVLARGRRPRRL